MRFYDPTIGDVYIHCGDLVSDGDLRRYGEDVARLVRVGAISTVDEGAMPDVGPHHQRPIQSEDQPLPARQPDGPPAGSLEALEASNE